MARRMVFGHILVLAPCYVHVRVAHSDFGVRVHCTITVTDSVRYPFDFWSPGGDLISRPFRDICSSKCPVPQLDQHAKIYLSYLTSALDKHDTLICLMAFPCNVSQCNVHAFFLLMHFHFHTSRDTCFLCLCRCYMEWTI